MTRITAHRGFSERFPENTLLAFREAVVHGADRLEMDVHVTADGKLMLHHYYRLGETDDGDGLIFLRDSTYLRSLDAGAWKSARFRGERIPYLEAIFTAIGHDTEYELDLKGFDEAFLRQVLDLVRHHGLLTSVELTSPSVLLLQRAKALETTIRVGMFSSSVVADWMPLELQQKKILATATLGNFDVIHCPVGILTPEFVSRAHSEGRLVHAADCNTRAELEAAFALGVDQLSTDRITLAVEVRSKATEASTSRSVFGV